MKNALFNLELTQSQKWLFKLLLWLLEKEVRVLEYNLRHMKFYIKWLLWIKRNLDKNKWKQLNWSRSMRFKDALFSLIFSTKMELLDQVVEIILFLDSYINQTLRWVCMREIKNGKKKRNRDYIKKEKESKSMN
jgi:hypothetical protein